MTVAFRDFHRRLHGPEQRAYNRLLREAAGEEAGDLKPHHPLSLLDEAVFAFVGEAFAAEGFRQRGRGSAERDESDESAVARAA